MATIGFIGLGNMGGPMAVNLVKAGHNVRGIDLSGDAMAKFKSEGGDTVDSTDELCSGADVVVTMLPAGRHVEEVYLSKGGLLSHCTPGTLFIDSSTIDVATSRRVAEKVEAAGMRMVDAPVSGGVTGAAAGTLTFMVGGTGEAFSAAKPYLKIMGKTIVHAGGAGNGQAAKICNNMILGISMIGVCEAFTLAEQLGLEHQTLFDISSTASGQCWSLNTYCPVPGPVPNSPANRDYAAGFTAAMMLKDLKLAQDAAQEGNVSTPLGAQARALYQMFCSKGSSDTDFSGIIKMLRGSS